MADCYDEEMKGGEQQMLNEQKKIIPKEYVCERCSHHWIPRSAEKPRVCPDCGSAYWDRPRKIPVEQENGKQ